MKNHFIGVFTNERERESLITNLVRCLNIIWCDHFFFELSFSSITGFPNYGSEEWSANIAKLQFLKIISDSYFDYYYDYFKGPPRVLKLLWGTNSLFKSIVFQPFSSPVTSTRTKI